MVKKSQKINQLREKAIAKLKASGSNNNLNIKDVDDLIEELSIYQIELEMQNEELLNVQENLEKERKRFKDLYDLAPVAYITVNKTGNILNLNHKAAELFGKPRELFNLNSIFPYLHEDSKSEFRNLIQELFDTGLSIGHPITFVGKDDYLIYTKINGELLTDSNGEDNVMLTITDIIDEKQRHDEALKFQELKYGEIFNNTLDAIFLFPYNSDNKPGNFVEVNKKACDLFETDDRTLLEWSPQQININPNVSYLNRAAKEILKTTNTLFEAVHTNQKGEEIPIEVSSHKFQIRGRDWGVVLIRDISERKEAQLKLQASEEKYKLLAENMSDTVIFTDLSMNNLYVSPSIEKISGYTREEYAKHKAEDFLTKESLKKFNQEKERIISIINDPSYNFKEFTNHLVLDRYHKDGRIITVDVIQSFVVDDEKPTGILTVMRDVTDKYRVEQEIKTANLRLELAMDVGNLGWWEWDYENDILNTADKKPELLGYKPDEVNFSAQEYIDMIHPDDYNEAMDAMRRHLKGENDRYEVEYRLRTKSGEYKWLYDVGKVLERAEDGKPRRLLGVIYDISDRKAKEEKIIKSEHDLLLLLTNLDDIVFEHAADSTFINLWTNNEQELFYPKDKIIGRKPNEVFPEPMSGIITSAINDAKETGKPAYRTYRGLKGSKYYNAKVTPYLDEVTNEMRFVSLVRDVTERRKANLTIQQQNEELEELNATKDKFFSIISHDLKNPFNTILGFTSELIDNFEDIPVEDQKKQIKIIHDSARQNFNLLQNLLVWSRTQSKRMPYNPETIQLEELIYENQQLYQQTADAKGVKIIREPYPLAKIHVYADRAMLNTSIRNLLSNAIKYTPKGGGIKMGCTIEDDQKARIFVKDNGVGIDPEMIPKLFKIDETFSLPGTEKEQGTGLGLILVKEFVEQNNGTIYVESEKDKGSVFSIVLNQTEAENKHLPAELDYENISQKVLNLPKEQLSYYSKEIVARFKSCVKSYSSRKVDSFSKDLKKFSRENKLVELESLSDHINEAMCKFDINKLNHCLDDFKKLNVILEEDMK
jgi:PAS domain S-box-containing protein